MRKRLLLALLLLAGCGGPRPASGPQPAAPVKVGDAVRIPRVLADLDDGAQVSNLAAGSNAHFSGKVRQGGAAAPISDSILTVGDDTTNRSVDAAVVSSRTIASGTGNAHCFSDSSTVSRSGSIGYNSFDARAKLTISSFDHYAGFQINPEFDITGQTIAKYYGFYSAPVITAGTLTDAYGAYITDPTGAGTIGTSYGLYIAAQTKGGTNYQIYSPSGSAYFGSGTITGGRGVFTSSLDASYANGLLLNATIAHGDANYTQLDVQGNIGSTAAHTLSGLKISTVLGGQFGSADIGLNLAPQYDSTIANTGFMAPLYIANFAKNGAGANVPPTSYGIYLETQNKSTTNWQLYSVGGDSAFGGNTRLGGVTAPTNPLSVTGNADISGTLQIGGAYTLDTSLKAVRSSSNPLVGDIKYTGAFVSTGKGTGPMADHFTGVYSRANDDAAVVNKSISNCVNNGAGLIRVTCTGHTFATSDRIAVYGVTGTTEANGAWTITVIDANTFDLQGSTFTNAYVSGGTATNRPAIYCFAATVVPSLDRGGLSGTAAHGDDMVGYVVYNGGTKKATDALYVGRNSGITGSEWTSGLTVDGYTDYGIHITGTCATAAITVPNNAYYQARNNANSADLSLFRANTGDEFEVGVPARFNSGLTVGNGTNISFGTTTGTKIGTSTSQMIGFWNATPVVQQSGMGATPTSNTAAATYGTNEQTMLQEAHDHIRLLEAKLKTLGIVAN